MEDNIFEKYKCNLISDCMYVNTYADVKDIGRNHVNYGCAITWATVLRGFGHQVEDAAYGDGEYLRVCKIIIDGSEIIL